MKYYHFRVVRIATETVCSHHKQPEPALACVKLFGAGYAAESRDLRDRNVWHRFDQWPTQEMIKRYEAYELRGWRERKCIMPYYMTHAGAALGIDGLHALGLELAELESLGLLELFSD